MKLEASNKVIDGKQLAEHVRESIRVETEQLIAANMRPGLAVVLIGDNPASQVYVRNKARTCERLGMYSEVLELAGDVSNELVMQVIAELNDRADIHGILIQLPLPEHLNSEQILDCVADNKDVDGFSMTHVGRLVSGREGFVPCTPAGIMVMLEHLGVDISGKHAVIVGRSGIVGKPMAHLLLQANATVTICHSRTTDLKAYTSQADILVAAIGRSRLIGRGHVKEGAIVIDVGMNRLDDGKLCGDVDYDEVFDKVGAITPVPGGVGPMTIAMLMKNTLTSAKRSLAEQQRS